MLRFFCNSILNHRQDEQDILKAFESVIKANPLLAVSIKVHQNQWNKAIVFSCKDEKINDLITDILKDIISVPSRIAASRTPTPRYGEYNISCTIFPEGIGPSQDHNINYARTSLHMRDKISGEHLAGRINHERLRIGLELLLNYSENPAPIADTVTLARTY